jgi:hypothetical protein
MLKNSGKNSGIPEFFQNNSEIPEFSKHSGIAITKTSVMEFS